jgi:hypothetical protein
VLPARDNYQSTIVSRTSHININIMPIRSIHRVPSLRGGSAGSASNNSRNCSRTNSDGDLSGGCSDSVTSTMSVVDHNFLAECQRLGISQDLAHVALVQSRERSEAWWKKAMPSSHSKSKSKNKTSSAVASAGHGGSEDGEDETSSSGDKKEEKSGSSDGEVEVEDEDDDREVLLHSVQSIFSRQGSSAVHEAEAIVMCAHPIIATTAQKDFPSDIPFSLISEKDKESESKEDNANLKLDDNSLDNPDDDDDRDRNYEEEHMANVAHLLKAAKHEVLKSLKETNGDTTNERFSSGVRALSSIYHGSGFHLQKVMERVPMEGTWRTISKPQYSQKDTGDNSRTNSRGYYVYTLGRMSFDMFRPTDLQCSIHDTIVKTRTLEATKGDQLPREIPRSLQKEVSAFGAVDEASHTGSKNKTTSDSIREEDKDDEEEAQDVNGKGEGGGEDNKVVSSETTTKRDEKEAPNAISKIRTYE